MSGRWLLLHSTGVVADLDNSVKDRRTMKISRLTEFATARQCTDEVIVGSRGTPRSQTSVTWWIWWLASAAEKDGERGEGYITVYFKLLINLKRNGCNFYGGVFKFFLVGHKSNAWTTSSRSLVFCDRNTCAQANHNLIWHAQIMYKVTSISN